MEKAQYEAIAALDEHKLYEFITGKDNSERKWVALHLLKLRRNRILTKTAQSSARAAWIAAGIAGVSAVIAFLAYYHRPA